LIASGQATKQMVRMGVVMLKKWTGQVEQFLMIYCVQNMV